jgi:hypothetical protein
VLGHLRPRRWPCGDAAQRGGGGFIRRSFSLTPHRITPDAHPRCTRSAPTQLPEISEVGGQLWFRRPCTSLGRGIRPMALAAEAFASQDHLCCICVFFFSDPCEASSSYSNLNYERIPAWLVLDLTSSSFSSSLIWILHRFL